MTNVINNETNGITLVDTNEQRERFIDENCHNCKRQKPLTPRARCDLWHGLKTGSAITLSITHLFIKEDGTCKYIEARNGNGQT